METALEAKKIGELIFVDPAGRKRTLRMRSGTSTAAAEGEFALPPVPPEGAFDVRFSHTQGVTVLIDPQGGSRTYPLEISDQSGNLMLHWNLTEPRLRAKLIVGEGRTSSDYILSGEGSLSLATEAGTTHAVLSATMTESPAKELPRELTLFQNFPNPFNPSTTIEYFLPFAAQVRLAVFDLLGNRVKEILKANQTAGYHQARWDAGNESSGVYYYRLEATNPSEPARAYRVSMNMYLIR